MDCGGYKKDFKWRPFAETNVKANLDKQQRGTCRLAAQAEPVARRLTIPTVSSPPRRASADSTRPTSSPEVTLSRPSISRGTSEGVRKDSKRSSTAENGPTSAQLAPRPAKAKRKNKVLPNETDIAQQPNYDPVDADETRPSPERRDLPNLQCVVRSQSRPLQDSTPTTTENPLPFAGEDTGEDDFLNFALPEGMQFSLATFPSLMIDPALLNDDETPDDTLEEVQASQSCSPDDPPPGVAIRRESSSSRSSPGPDDFLQLWHGPLSYVFEQPYFAQDSPEMLTYRFDKLTCGILSVMDGPNDNPWRTLIWPLAQQSPALYHAVTAMTAFHSSTDVPALRVVGHEHKQASIRYIQEGIRDNTMDDQIAIATALALGFSESWDQHTATGNTHIKGAQALVKRALEAHKANPLCDVELARLKFLCNAWVYMDVIARLTSVDSDESNDFDQTFYFDPMPPQSDSTGFGIDFGMPIDARLDPLMGCANTLFPLVGRVANLVRKVCRSQTNSPAVISQANDIKLALEAWEPPAFIERPEDPTTDVQHTLQTAEAYRWAALLHLHQSVPELPSPTSAELARRVLQYLATVPLASRTVIVHIFPMMVASCEARSPEDRLWVRERWAAMGQRMRIGVIEKSATVMEEVWRRRDAYEAQPTTRRRLVATADLQPVRQRDTPLARAGPTDPGRTGMVFTYVEGDGDGKPTSGQHASQQRRAWGQVPGRVPGAMDAAYTARGHCHWIGVMWDWGWEGQSPAQSFPLSAACADRCVCGFPY